MDFWERLDHEVRLKSSRKALADAAGIAPNTFSTWKARGTIPDGAVLLKLAKALNVSMEYLVSGVEREDSWLRQNQDFIANLRMLPPAELQAIKQVVEQQLPHPELLASHRALLRKFMEVPNATEEPQRSAYWRECARWGLISSDLAEELATVPTEPSNRNDGQER